MNADMPTICYIVYPLSRYPSIHRDEPIGTAVNRLLNSSSYDGIHLHFDELLVLNRSKELVGHLSIRDIICCFFPSVMQSSTPVFSGKQEQFTELSSLLGSNFHKECRRQLAQPAERYMTAPKNSIPSNTHLLHALEIMVKENRNSLPVLESNILIGAVRINDIFRVLGTTYCTAL